MPYAGDVKGVGGELDGEILGNDSPINIQVRLRAGLRADGRIERLSSRRSDDADFLGFLALTTGGHLEFHRVALVQALVSASLDVREVHEHVCSTLT